MHQGLLGLERQPQTAAMGFSQRDNVRVNPFPNCGLQAGDAEIIAVPLTIPKIDQICSQASLPPCPGSSHRASSARTAATPWRRDAAELAVALLM
jgi:hypothetical protein